MNTLWYNILYILYPPIIVLGLLSALKKDTVTGIYTLGHMKSYQWSDTVHRLGQVCIFSQIWLTSENTTVLKYLERQVHIHQDSLLAGYVSWLSSQCLWCVDQCHNSHRGILWVVTAAHVLLLHCHACWLHTWTLVHLKYTQHHCSMYI